HVDKELVKKRLERAKALLEAKELSSEDIRTRARPGKEFMKDSGELKIETESRPDRKKASVSDDESTKEKAILERKSKRRSKGREGKQASRKKSAPAAGTNHTHPMPAIQEKEKIEALSKSENDGDTLRVE